LWFARGGAGRCALQPGEARLRPLIAGVGDATGLAAREAVRARGDPSAWRWVAVGLVIALQGACVCALSGYETAEPGDVLDPASVKKIARWQASEAGLARGPRPAGRLAAVETLLRRVSSPDYLGAPERLEMSRRRQGDALRLVDMRNSVVHFTGRGQGFDDGELRAPVAAVCEIVSHLLLTAPAFDPAPHTTALGSIARDIEQVLGALATPG
jgi:hypothetical protein